VCVCVCVCVCVYVYVLLCVCVCGGWACTIITTRVLPASGDAPEIERWGAGVETQKNVWGEIGGWGRVPCNETYAPSLSTIYDGA